MNLQNKEVSLTKDKNFSIEVFPRNSEGLDGCWTWGKNKVEENVVRLIAKQTSGGKWRIFRKDYLYDDQGEKAATKAKAIWLEPEINNENGKEICNQIFKKCPFDFPKSVEFIGKCLKLGSNPGDTILDSFAGSGTTAHAVLALNMEDGGNRKFILVEMEDYADTITAERVRRVIKGVKDAKDENLKKGLGGTFSYFEIGKPIEMESILSGTNLPSYNELARYVFYTATGEEFNEKKVDENKSFIGESKEYEVYLFYKPDLSYLKNTALTLDKAKELRKVNTKKRLVFAPTKYLDQEKLDEYRVVFAQLPFEIYKLAK